MSEDIDLIDFAIKKINESTQDYNSFLDDSINKEDSVIPNNKETNADSCESNTKAVIQQSISANDISIHEFQPSESIECSVVTPLKRQKTDSQQSYNNNDFSIESSQYEIDISFDPYDDILSDAFAQLIQETEEIDEDIKSDPSTPQDSKKRKLPLWMSETKSLDKHLRKKIFSITQTRSRSKIELMDSVELEMTSIDTSYQLINDPTLISKGRVICFDLETTGFSRDDGIIEIGAVEYVNGIRTGAIFQSYVCPKMPVNIFASKVHGLTNKKLESAPPIDIILNSFMNWVGDAPLVAHNALFDMRLLVLFYFLIVNVSNNLNK